MSFYEPLVNLKWASNKLPDNDYKNELLQLINTMEVQLKSLSYNISVVQWISEQTQALLTRADLILPRYAQKIISFIPFISRLYPILYISKSLEKIQLESAEILSKMQNYIKASQPCDTPGFRKISLHIPQSILYANEQGAFKAIMIQGWDYKRGKSKGYCAGYTHSFAIDIYDNKKPFLLDEFPDENGCIPFVSLSEQIFNGQKEQHIKNDRFARRRIGFKRYIDSVDAMVSRLLDPSYHSGNVREITLGGLFNLYKHSVSFMRDKFGRITFVDADYGYFEFLNEKEFTHFLRLYLNESSYRCLTYSINEFVPDVSDTQQSLSTIFTGKVRTLLNGLKTIDINPSTNWWKQQTASLLGGIIIANAVIFLNLSMIIFSSPFPFYAIGALSFCLGYLVSRIVVDDGIVSLWHNLRCIISAIWHIAEILLEHINPFGDNKPSSESLPTCEIMFPISENKSDDEPYMSPVITDHSKSLDNADESEGILEEDSNTLKSYANYRQTLFASGYEHINDGAVRKADIKKICFG